MGFSQANRFAFVDTAQIGFPRRNDHLRYGICACIFGKSVLLLFVENCGRLSKTITINTYKEMS